MAEDHLRNQRFAYSTNANLVLQADRETRRVRNEASGEVERYVYMTRTAITHGVAYQHAQYMVMRLSV